MRDSYLELVKSESNIGVYRRRFNTATSFFLMVAHCLL